MRLKNTVQLFLAAFIWGVAFVAQRAGMDHVGPFTFNAVRNLLGALVLLPVLALRREKTGSGNGKTLLAGGLCCGLCLCVAGNLQQVGIQYTTVGKAGFLTACYIVLVPILGILLGRRCSRLLWAAVGLAVLGLYLLCMHADTFALSKGDGLMLCCSLVFAMHILSIDHFSPRVDPVGLSCIQFLVCSLASAFLAVIFERPNLADIKAAWLPIGYAGILSCGVAYTLQVAGQKGADPTVSSLILSLESCVAVLAGWILLGQKLSARELLGCVVMFVAIVLAQLPEGEVAHGSP